MLLLTAESSNEESRNRGWSCVCPSGNSVAAAAQNAPAQRPPLAMGSRLSRQSSLDNENFSKKRRRLQDSAGEGDRSGRGGGDFLFALMLKSDKLPGMLRRANNSPYMRRVAWINEIQKLLRERRIEQATDVLKLLRKVRRELYTGDKKVKGQVLACYDAYSIINNFPITE
ncbi:hypothetical protein GOODEAATRI_007053 [Goodea atripinnis]|uniref:Uncharacterized protein n=1 Tax=Goodea atripinnis TaxID=208336 RepID=A0ABV0PC52_9TELE